MAVKKAPQPDVVHNAPHDITISHCHFGPKVDAEYVKAVAAIAKALEVNAASLGDLSRTLVTPQWHMDNPLLSIGG